MMLLSIMVERYIHDGDWVIQMKFGKDMIYVLTQDSTNQGIDKLIKVMITLDNPWNPVSINDKL